MATLDLRDLRKVYLHTFDAFATTPQDVADNVEGINTKYARQLLADLITNGLVVQSEGPEGDVWQSILTYDDLDRTEAESNFDGAYNTNKEKEMRKTATATKPAKTETYHDCYCGCGEQVPSKSFYRPGHDARHAGQVGKEIARRYTEEGFDRRELLADLPSERLTAKAEAIAEKAIERAEAKEARKRTKADKAAEVDAGDDGTANTEQGTVKVGKNEYAAVRYTATGVVEYFKGSDTLKASKTAAKTFTVE